MAKDKDQPNASNAVEETADNNATVFIDASQDNNAIGMWDDAIIPHTDNHAKRLVDAKARKQEAKDANRLIAYQNATKDVSKLSKWELTGKTIEDATQCLMDGVDTYCETGKWKRDGDGNGNAQLEMYKIVSRDGKLHSKVKDSILEVENAITIIRDGKKVTTKTVTLSEYFAWQVEQRKLGFRKNVQAQKVMRLITGHENTTFHDVPEPEKVEKDDQGRLNVTCKVTFTTTDMRRVLQDGIDQGYISNDGVKALPFASAE